MTNHSSHRGRNMTSKLSVGIARTIFRASYIIKSAFQCLNITGDNIGTLIATVGGNPQSHAKMARDALAALRTGPMVLTERILSHIEDTWTGTLRRSRHAGKDDRKFCSIVYRVSISDSWELTRAIVCFAVDQSGLGILRRHARLQRKGLRSDGLENTGQIVDENAVTTILQSLRNRDDRDILSNAMSQIHEIWKPVKQLTKQEYRQVGPLAEGDIVLAPKTWAGGAIANIVYGTYKRHRQPGLLEPDFPYLRFSARLDQLDSKMSASKIPTLPLRDVEQPPEIVPKSSALLCRQDRNGNHLCVFSPEVHQNPPAFAEIVSALGSALKVNHLFILNRWNWYRPDKKGERGAFFTPTVQLGDRLIPVIQAAAFRWLITLCDTFDKRAFENFASIFEVDTSHEALEKLSRMEKGLDIRHQERPFAPRLNDPPPAKGNNIHSRNAARHSG